MHACMHTEFKFAKDFSRVFFSIQSDILEAYDKKKKKKVFLVNVVGRFLTIAECGAKTARFFCSYGCTEIST